MGRGHGGTGSSTWRSGGPSDTTMSGYSRTLAKAISGKEESIRNMPIEYGIIVDTKGNILSQNVGEAHQVQIKGVWKDNIVTHNHPSGHSFSNVDLFNAAINDAAEMRAVGRNYSYSIKRPEKGWGVDGTHHGKEVTRSGRVRDNASVRLMKGRYARAVDKVRTQRDAYIRNYKGDKDVARRRADAIFYHQVNRIFARQMGWNYSKSKVH